MRYSPTNNVPVYGTTFGENKHPKNGFYSQ